MKFASGADIEDYTKALKVGGIKGALFGFSASLVGAFVLKRKTSFFVNAGGFQRGLVFVAPAVFSAVVNMENSSRHFEQYVREKQHGLSAGDMEDRRQHKDASLYDETKEWFSANKYKVVVAGWAASMGGSFWLVNRDKYMTKAQKIVQARVYAQGATVAMLIATVILSGVAKSSDKEKSSAAARSWERDISFVEHANHPSISEDELDKVLNAKNAAFKANTAHRAKDPEVHAQSEDAKPSPDSSADRKEAAEPRNVGEAAQQQTSSGNALQSKPEAKQAASGSA